MTDTWRCECGYTNIGAKTCIVCRRPRQAIAVAVAQPATEPLPDEGPAARVKSAPARSARSAVARKSAVGKASATKKTAAKKKQARG